MTYQLYQHRHIHMSIIRLTVFWYIFVSRIQTRILKVTRGREKKGHIHIDILPFRYSGYIFQFIYRKLILHECTHLNRRENKKLCEFASRTKRHRSARWLILGTHTYLYLSYSENFDLEQKKKKVYE